MGSQILKMQCAIISPCYYFGMSIQDLMLSVIFYQEKKYESSVVKEIYKVFLLKNDILFIYFKISVNKSVKLYKNIFNVMNTANTMAVANIY